MRVLSGRSESAGIMNFLLEAGYPVCMSNRTDPFSASNVAHSLAVLKILAQRENGIFFQTKGGTGLDDAFDILGNKKNVVFYITITTKNESVRKRMEPGAPKYEDRVELARRAKMAGYEVIVAINPCFEPWMPEQDLVSVESDLASVGVDRFIFQRLMLNKKDVNKFTGFRASQFADGETDAACKKSGIYHQAQVERQLAKGLHALSFGMPFKTDFFGSVRDCLGKSMPSNYDFFNWCFTSGKKILTFGDYMSCIFGGDRSDLLTFRGREMQNYIMGYDRAVWKPKKPESEDV
jgi:DNA repair photolyase